MRTVLVVLALLSAAPKPNSLKADAIAAFHALTPSAIEAKAGAVPAGTWQRIDVSEKNRSASFGHSTMLVVTSGASTFFIEYGRSTNSPAQTFGPFELHPAAVDAGASVKCGTTTCPGGMVCCNESCGICAPPDGACLQEFCVSDAGR